jgi:hypothetical protein
MPRKNPTIDSGKSIPRVNQLMIPHQSEATAFPSPPVFVGVKPTLGVPHWVQNAAPSIKSFPQCEQNIFFFHWHK